MLLLGVEGLHKPRNSNTVPSVVVPIAPSNLWADACVPIGSAVVTFLSIAVPAGAFIG
jgi:hypothetical protein